MKSNVNTLPEKNHCVTAKRVRTLICIWTRSRTQNQLQLGIGDLCGEGEVLKNHVASGRYCRIQGTQDTYNGGNKWEHRPGEYRWLNCLIAFAWQRVPPFPSQRAVPPQAPQPALCFSSLEPRGRSRGGRPTVAGLAVTQPQTLEKRSVCNVHAYHLCKPDGVKTIQFMM